MSNDAPQPLTPRQYSTNPLVRPVEGRIVAGVLAGVARRLGWNPWLVRILFLLSMILPGPQFLIYLALWIIVPSES